RAVHDAPFAGGAEGHAGPIDGPSVAASGVPCMLPAPAPAEPSRDASAAPASAPRPAEPPAPPAPFWSVSPVQLEQAAPTLKTAVQSHAAQALLPGRTSFMMGSQRGGRSLTMVPQFVNASVVSTRKFEDAEWRSAWKRSSE